MTTTGRMVVIYRTPADPTAFDKHYVEVHVPLAHQLPGLRRYEVSKRPLDALRQAFGTPEGRACAADRRVLAPRDEDVQMYLFEASEV